METQEASVLSQIKGAGKMRKNWGGLPESVKQAQDDAQVVADAANTEAVSMAGLALTPTITASTSTAFNIAPPASLHGKFVAVKRPETKAEEAVVHNGVARQDQRTKLVAATVVIASESFAVGDTVYFKPEALRTQGSSTLILPAHGTEAEIPFVWMPESAVIACRRVWANPIKAWSHTCPPFPGTPGGPPLWSPPLAPATPVLSSPYPYPYPPGITWNVTNEVKN